MIAAEAQDGGENRVVANDVREMARGTLSKVIGCWEAIGKSSAG